MNILGTSITNISKFNLELIKTTVTKAIFKMEPPVGFEPTTHCLQNSCSTS